MATSLILTRHGLTPRSRPEQHLGQRLDIELSIDGRNEARLLGVRLAGLRFDRVISSPLRRAVETARLAVPDQPCETDARLLEMDYGAWEGLTYEQIEALDPDARRRWELDPAGRSIPGGESGADVARRARLQLRDLVDGARPSVVGGRRLPGGKAALGDVAGHVADRRLLIVGHSSLNRVLLCVALGVPVRDFRRRFVQDQCNLTVIRFTGPAATAGAQLLLYNDVAHLRGTSGATWDQD